MNAVFREPFREFVQTVEPEKEIAEGDAFRIGLESQVALMHAFGIKFIQIDTVIDFVRGLVVVDDGQRHEHRARPVAHLPEIDVKPFADQQHFARNRRDIFPREQAEEREIQLGKRVHARHAAEMQRHFARLQHARVGRRHARELEGEIRLDGGVDFRRAAVIDVPAAVRQLHREDVVDGLALPFRVHAVVPVVIGHHV